VSADGARAGSQGSGAGSGHRRAAGGQEGSPSVGDDEAGRERRPGDGGVHVRPMFEREREREREKGAGGSTQG
jgi:hypothetical protein